MFGDGGSELVELVVLLLYRAGEVAVLEGGRAYELVTFDGGAEDLVFSVLDVGDEGGEVWIEVVEFGLDRTCAVGAFDEAFGDETEDLGHHAIVDCGRGGPCFVVLGPV